MNSFSRTFNVNRLLVVMGLAALPMVAAADGDNEANAVARNEVPAASASKTPAENTTTTLFVIGPNMGFVGFDHAETLSGQKVAATTDLMLSRKTVTQPKVAAVDSRGALYLLSRSDGGSIAIYDKPLTATGSRGPDRKVFGEATQISKSPTGIAIDRENDLLYVSNTMTDTLVFDISDPDSFTGAVAPVLTFDVDVAQFRPTQLCFANGSLYMVDARGDTSDIIAFDNPGTLRGKVTPDRTIAHGGFDNKIGVYVDAKDRLLVGVRKLGQVLIFANAAKLDGFAAPDVALSIAGAKVSPQPSYAITDSQDRLYVADATGNVTFSFDDVSKLASGEHYPDRTVKCRDIIAPNRLVVVER